MEATRTRTHPDLEDLDLKLARQGRRDAFERLVRQHQEIVVRTLRNYLGHDEDALDVAQETFLKVYLRLGGFRGGSSFRTWVLQIALNTARSLRTRERALKRQPTGGCVSLSHLPGQEVADTGGYPSPPAMLEAEELSDGIHAALGTLDSGCRGLLYERNVLGDSYDRIAERRSVPVGTVKSQVHRARAQIRRRLAAYL